jgi:predicted acylesterase/phospholipase RssA
MDIENIAFSGGGIGGIAYIGVLEYLEEQRIIPHVRQYSGCSVGAIFATLISLGYSSVELKCLIENFRYKTILDIQLLGLLENLGIETGRRLMLLLGKLIHRKIGRMDITFEEHWQITGKRLFLNASCVETDTVEYFSVVHTPKMSVLKAIQMSIAIPPIIAAVKYNGKTYVDGGVHVSLPITLFESSKTLGFQLENESMTIENIHPFILHIYRIILSLYRRVNYDTFGPEYKIIHIKTGTRTLKINLSKEERINTIRRGYESCKETFIII